MSSFKGQCSHKSIPVEMDERMSPCDPDYGPHVCECNEQEGGMSRQREGSGGVLPKEDSRTDQRHPPTSTANWWNPSVAGPTSVTPHRLPHFHQYDVNTSAYYHDPSDVSLEPPGPLISNCGPLVPQRYPVQKQGGVPTGHRQYACCPPDHHHNFMRPPHENTPRDMLQPRNAGQASSPQKAAAPIDVMHERSVDPCVLPGPGPVTREVRRTISLPEESRKVFITYSMDIAKEIIPFTTFLINQGFKPECDIFDTPIRRMGITKWMDSFLNDKSVLIIVVISPKYKKDVEGGGDDEHSQHTKYIHNQIQNEYIQQGCLNFRLVPVLFSTATKFRRSNSLYLLLAGRRSQLDEEHPDLPLARRQPRTCAASTERGALHHPSANP
ncbi:Adapter protein CIKS [Oryzias melastigma]|uniref:Adapter protein CIKS n=1 Tax=Oryzias melastigma TaxID=30732 RepID=A0A834CI66_ORYME|nr:Adapter protein CIKS [Oryzias melastigma]